MEGGDFGRSTSGRGEDRARRPRPAISRGSLSTPNQTRSRRCRRHKHKPGGSLTGRVDGGRAKSKKGASQLLRSFLPVAFAILRSFADPQARAELHPRSLQPLSPQAFFIAALYARAAIGIDPLSGSRLSLRAQMYAGPSSRSDAADDGIGSGANVLDRVAAKWADDKKLKADDVRTDIEALLQQKAYAPWSGAIGETLVNVLDVNLELHKRYGDPA